MNMRQFFQQRVEEIYNNLVEIRRYLHTHPELSYQEEKTMQYVSGILKELGISHTTNVGGFGIVGIIEGKNPSSKTIALRGDMDALPITDEKMMFLINLVMLA
jgi:amidohydrolase